MLKVSDLSIGYLSPLTSPLNFELNTGELLIVSGANGSGKSTLIKTLEGRLEALSGIVSSSFQLMTLPQHYKANLRLSLTLSELRSLYQIPTVVNRALLNEVPPHLKWNELSGGMRQRVMLALSLAKGAEVLILDEPANHLDARGISELTKLLTTLLEQGIVKAMIIVSHIPLIDESATTKIKIKRLSLC